MTDKNYIVVQTRGKVTSKPFYSENGKGVFKATLETENHVDSKTYPSLIAFGDDAKMFAEQVEKGDTVHIQGSYLTGSYTNQQGFKQKTADILIKALKVEQKASIMENSSNIDISNDNLPF